MAGKRKKKKSEKKKTLRTRLPLPGKPAKIHVPGNVYDRKKNKKQLKNEISQSEDPPNKD